MIPLSLRLRNFMSYGDDAAPLDFSRFTTACLTGDNGHGKSTLLDAITWALWGETRAKNLDDAIEKANGIAFGLSAGVVTRDLNRALTFADRIQAGVVYVNRRAGATTGAWPGVQPFGGWKGSGTTGRGGGGLHYVQQYLHEQAQSVIKD